MKNQREQIETRMKLINKIKEEEVLIKNWKIYLEMVGKNGISKIVLRNALPLINGELYRMLNDICDFTVEVDIDDHNDVAFYLLSKYFFGIIILKKNRNVYAKIYYKLLS